MMALKCRVFFSYFFFVSTVKARMRANTHNAQQGEQETRGVGEGRKKDIVEQRHEEICGRERGMGWGTWGKQDGHDTDFQEGKQGI